MTAGIPPVALVIVTYNSADQIELLLSTVAEGLRDVQAHRIVVVDNASSDGSPALARRLAPDATVVETGANLGYGAAINVAERLLDPAEAMLVLNADVQLDPGAVRKLLAACDDPQVGVAVPTVRRPDGTAEPTLRRRPTALRTWGEMLLGARAGRFGPLGEVVHSARSRDVDWANGAVMMIPGPVRALVGPWREDLFLYGEEVDYCRRVRSHGLRVRSVPAATAVHRGGDVARNPALWAQLTTNKVVEAVMSGHRWSGPAVWAALVFGSALRVPLRRGTHRCALRALIVGRPSLLRGRPTNPAAPDEFRRYLASGAT